MWRSLVARLVRDEEVVGSNPAIPTTFGRCLAHARHRPRRSRSKLGRCFEGPRIHWKIDDFLSVRSSILRRPTKESDVLTERRRWVAFWILCLGELMVVLDSTVVNVALPSI